MELFTIQSPICLRMSFGAIIFLMLFSYFLFNFIALYIILKLRPPQTQHFLKC